MPPITRNAFSFIAILAVLALAATSEAAWPRYRVSAGYSLPSAPAMRPMFVPVYPTERYLQANPGVVPATYGQPLVPNVMVPNGMAPGTVPAANMPPSLLAPPQVSVPNTSYYPQTYNAPQYNQQPAYTPYNYNTPATTMPPPTTSYYNPPAYQPYQQPRPIQPYTGAVQPYGGFYQPTRPSTFYSPTPSYYPQQPVFGQY
jgi:hypothetical protein